jgi:ribosome biogenesis GTPase A
MTGAIKEQVLNVIEIAMLVCTRMRALYPDLFCARYKLVADEIAELEPYNLFLLVGRRRGFLISGGEVHSERTANMLLDEYRAGKIGRITLDARRDD